MALLRSGLIREGGEVDWSGTIAMSVTKTNYDVTQRMSFSAGGF